MGTSTDAILAFGWNLGDAYDIEEQFEEDEDVSTGDQIEIKLLSELVNFTEQWTPEASDYWQRKREAEESMGVEIIYHCSGDFPMLFLAARGSESRASRGSPEIIDNLETQEEWIQNLQKAADALDLKDLGEPSWQLFSMWG